MSGEAVARALGRRFQEIRRAELVRLQKKLARLGPVERADVDAITAEIVEAIAACARRALVPNDGQSLAQIVVELFRVCPVANRPPGEDRACQSSQASRDRSAPDRTDRIDPLPASRQIPSHQGDSVGRSIPHVVGS